MADENIYLDYTFREFLDDTGRQDAPAVANSLEKVTKEIIQDKVPKSQLAKIMAEKGYDTFLDVPLRYSNNPEFIREVFETNKGVLKAAGIKNPGTKLEQIRNVTTRSLEARALPAAWSIFTKGAGKKDVKKPPKGLRVIYPAKTGLSIRRVGELLEDYVLNNKTLQALRPNATPELIAKEALVEFAIKTLQGPRDADFVHMNVEGLTYKNNLMEFVTKTQGGQSYTPRVIYDETKALLKGFLGDDINAIKSKSKKTFVFWDDLKDDSPKGNRYKYSVALQKVFNELLSDIVPKATTIDQETGVRKKVDFTSSFLRKRSISILESQGLSEVPVAPPSPPSERDAVFGRQGTDVERVQSAIYKGTREKATGGILKSGNEVVAGNLLTHGFRNFQQYANHLGLKIVGKLPNVIYNPETIIGTNPFTQEFDDFMTHGLPVTNQDGRVSRTPYKTYVATNQVNFVKNLEDIVPENVTSTSGERSSALDEITQDRVDAETAVDQRRGAKRADVVNDFEARLTELYPDLDDNAISEITKQTKIGTDKDNLLTIKQSFLEAEKLDSNLRVLQPDQMSAALGDERDFFKQLYQDGIIDEKQLDFGEKYGFLPMRNDADIPASSSAFGRGATKYIEKSTSPTGITTKSQKSFFSSLADMPEASEVSPPTRDLDYHTAKHLGDFKFDPDDDPLSQLKKLKSKVFKTGGKILKGLGVVAAPAAPVLVPFDFLESKELAEREEDQRAELLGPDFKGSLKGVNFPGQLSDLQKSQILLGKGEMSGEESLYHSMRRNIDPFITAATGFGIGDVIDPPYAETEENVLSLDRIQSEPLQLLEQQRREKTGAFLDRQLIKKDPELAEEVDLIKAQEQVEREPEGILDQGFIPQR